MERSYLTQTNKQTNPKPTNKIRNKKSEKDRTRARLRVLVSDPLGLNSVSSTKKKRGGKPTG